MRCAAFGWLVFCLLCVVSDRPGGGMLGYALSGITLGSVVVAAAIALRMVALWARSSRARGGGTSAGTRRSRCSCRALPGMRRL